MFKKRTVKKSGEKRIRKETLEPDRGDDNIDAVLDVKPISKGTTESKHDSPLEKLSDDDQVSNVKTPKLIDTKKEDLFKPDSSVEEQHRLLKDNEKRLIASENLQKKDSDGIKLYTGQISKKSKKEVLVKPSSSHVKQNYLMDYQRDVCKDFLKNGYCGFGDTCKFLHYREEFKKVERSGVKEWEAAAKKRRKF